MSERPILKTGVYCPICKTYFYMSHYLRRVFDHDRQLWIANMISHYRHNHVSYYDRWVGYRARKGSYEHFKSTVNERAKRQILRKCGKYMRAVGISVQDLKALRGNDPKTLKLAVKVLGGRSKALKDLKHPLKDPQKVSRATPQDPEASDDPEKGPQSPVQALLSRWL